MIAISSDRYVGLSARIFCFSALGFAVWFVLKYAGGAVAAVLALIAVSSAVNFGAERLASLSKLPKRLCAVLLVALLLSFAGTAVVWLSARLIRELEELSLWVSDNRGEIVLSLSALLGSVGGVFERLNIAEVSAELPEYVGELAVSLMNKALSLCFSAVGKPLGAIVGKAPSAIFWGVVLLISTVWLSVDYDRICGAVGRLFPKGLAARAEAIKGRLLHTVSTYLRAYALLFFLTLAETYVGLLILGVPYALLTSIAVAAVDILPMLGASAVLIPLAVFSMLTGSARLGVGLLVLCGVVVIVRQIAEPHIVGQRLGVHPFLSFISMLAGLYLFGGIGALLAPIVVAYFSFEKEK